MQNEETITNKEVNTNFQTKRKAEISHDDLRFSYYALMVQYDETNGG
jgi:hypothetical protein